MSDFTGAGWIFTGAARTSVRWRCNGEQEEQIRSSLEAKLEQYQLSWIVGLQVKLKSLNHRSQCESAKY